MDSPISGIRFIHKALRKEIDGLEEAAGQLVPEDEASAARLADRFRFFQETVASHAAGEEDALFPAMDARIYPVSTTYVMEHQAEERFYDEILRLLESFTGTKEESERVRTVRRVNRLAIAANATLTLHIQKEEQHLVPLVEAHFSIEEQGEIVSRSVAHFGPEQMQRVLPWMMMALTADEQDAYLGMMMRATPREAFRQMARWISEGVSSSQWEEMVRRIPDLAA